MNKEDKRGYINSIFSQNKGQVTIFIILAIVVVGAVVLFLLLRPEPVTPTGFNEENPTGFIQNCLEDKISDVVETISLQGGSVEPVNFISYSNSKVEYLCYTTEYYVPCIVQQPLLQQHIEEEIKNEISADVSSCFKALKENYEKKNYETTLTPGEIVVELLPKRIVTNFKYVLTVSKGSTRRYDSFSVILNNNLYELTSIANSIIEWEATYGDAETTTYMTYYPDLKVEKKNQAEGSTVYILTDRNTGKKFQFASRSVVWPSGFGDVPVFGGE